MGNGLLARLPRGRVPQVGRSDGWPPTLSASHRGGEPDRIPPTGRLTVTAAPLLGLLGTIIGMIRAFKLFGAEGLVDPRGVTGGVAEAFTR